MKKTLLILMLVLPWMGYAQQPVMAGLGDSLVRLGDGCLERGDTAGAMKFYDQAIAAGHYNAYVDKAMVCYDQGNVKQTLKYLRQGAKRGSSLCCNRLGDYYNGQEEYKKAAQYYTQADDPEGWYELGCLLLQGNIGEQSDADMARGLSLVRRSEKADYVDAIYMVMRMFANGVMLEENSDSALYMLRRLLDKEVPYANMIMAAFYEQGTGVEVDSLQAMAYYRRAGEAGVCLGYDFLADYYRYGYAGLKPDSLLAFQTYMLAAAIADDDDDNSICLMDVADCYLRGIGTHVDTAKAIAYLRDATEAGSARAASVLGDMYYYGRGGLTMSYDTAITYYHRASMGDDPRGDYMMGAYLYDAGAYDNAMGFIRSALYNGSMDALVLYAQALLTGNGVEANPTVAVSMLSEVASQDSSGHAHFLLGLAHHHGVGTEEDQPLALRYLDTAASLGSTRAMMELGDYYAQGEIVELDTLKAVEWYERAVEAGSLRAMMRLAGSYAQGSVAPKNLRRAAELYQMAADRGNTDAMCRLGLCYEEGNGVTLNSRRAYNLYMQAAESGSAWGMRLVAYCYVEAIYVEENIEEAVVWFRRAAEAGDAHSALVLGKLYLRGEGVKKNKKEARRWLQIAADAGMAEAAEILSTL